MSKGIVIDGNEIVYGYRGKGYTLNELKTKCDMYQKVYKADPDNEYKKRMEKSKLDGSLCEQESLLPGEFLEKYSENPDFEVSNLGRFWYQKRLIHQKEIKRGYFVFDFEDFKSRNNNKSIGKFNRNFLYTYQFVAAVFLEKKEGYGDVHHITNDGCDISTSNLIYLTRDYHNWIHGNSFNQEVDGNEEE